MENQDKKYYLKRQAILIFGLVVILSGLILILYGLGNIILKNSGQEDFIEETELNPGRDITNELSVWAKVTRVIDGDTIEVEIDKRNFKVRYIGVDTPETVDPRRPVACFGKEASLENKQLVEGKKVYLEKDISETDKYDRLLRYIYLPQDSGSLLFINDYLVRQGFAKVVTFPPDVKYSQQFIEAEREARENNRGLWQKCR